MSDHYSCKACGQQPDRCQCPDKPAVQVGMLGHVGRSKETLRVALAKVGEKKTDEITRLRAELERERARAEVLEAELTQAKSLAVDERWIRRWRQRLRLSPLSGEDVKTIEIFSRLIDKDYRFGAFWGAMSRKAERAAVKARYERAAYVVEKHGHRIAHILKMTLLAAKTAKAEDAAPRARE